MIAASYASLVVVLLLFSLILHTYTERFDQMSASNDAFKAQLALTLAAITAAKATIDGFPAKLAAALSDVPTDAELDAATSQLKSATDALSASNPAPAPDSPALPLRH